LSGHPFETRRQEIVVATAGPASLTPFIPAGLRETLVSGNVEPEHRPAAVAFIHYGEFDRFLAERGEDTAEALDHLVRIVQDSVDSRGVTFMATDVSSDGGKIILTAGVPGTTGNDEEQILLALREIVNTAKSDFPLHIGLNWGHVFSGEVGPSYRRTYTIMGDAVNLAARLMAKAPAGEIYTTAGVLDGSRTTFKVTAPEPFYVKGKKLPIQAFSVGEPEGSRAQAGSGHLALIGRDQELKQMLGAWESVASGVGQVVEVTADAGMGKTRLLEEFLVNSDHERVVRAECRLYQAATPYFPFRALLRGAWGMEDPDPAASEAQLRHLVQLYAPELKPWVALIGRPVGLDLAESPEVMDLEDQFRPVRTMVAVGALLEATVDSPTLFVIEDTHWMDEASRELLAGLQSGLSRFPWLFVLTRRPGDGGFLAPDTGSLTRIQLEPLGIDEAKALIENATEDAPLLPHQIENLAARAEGSPLFLIELLQALRRGGDVDALPHSVEGLIGARIDTLPSADRNVLRRVAVLGAGFRSEHTAAVLPDGAQWQGKGMRRLRDFLVVDQTGWVQFRHALIRDVAYQGLPYKTRLNLHAIVGDSIKKAAGANPDDQAELLSLHYSSARRWPEAWRYSVVAGDNAKTVYANLEAATFYRRALAAARFDDVLEATTKARVAESLGDVLEQSGLFQESVEAYRWATRLVGTDSLRQAELLLKRARARARMGSYRTAFRELAIGCRIVTAVGSEEAWRTRARLTALNAQLRQFQQHPRKALALARQAMAEAEESGEPEALARSYQVLDAAYNMLGQPSQAIFAPRALEIYEQMGDLPGVAIVTNNLGGQAYFEGRWDAAVEYYARAQDAFRRAGNELEVATSGANIGEVQVSQGKFREAEEVLTEAIRISRAHKALDAAIFAELQLARLKLSRGDEDAMAVLARIRSEALAVGHSQSAVEASIYLGLGLVKAEDAEGALELLAEAERASGGEAELYGSSVARVKALALAKLGRLQDAAEVALKGLARAREQGLMYEEALLLRTLAEFATEAEGKELLEEAERLLQQLGVDRAL
jgi:class 3 adenylate cyclase/tetratricopeptide (TPR) repeat protein